MKLIFSLSNSRNAIINNQNIPTNMKIFDVGEKSAKSAAYLQLQKQAAEIIVEICKVLQISISAMHASLWIFHSNALIMGYHHFDRYIYACGALLVGTKLMESIRYPTQILGACRKILRRNKNLDDEDSEEYLKKEVKRVFQAEVNIMINIGFDFDIRLALQQAENLGLFYESYFENFSLKLKQTLTSLYLSQVVVFVSPQNILYLALKLILKRENRSIQAVEFSEAIKARISSQQVKQAQKQYVLRSIF